MDPLFQLNNQHSVDFILPSQEKAESRPIISIKIPKRVSQEQVQSITSIWDFFTLGIPLLFDALSLLFSGLLHRETIDAPLRVRFKHERLTIDKVNQIFEFQKFNEVTSQAFNQAELNHAIHQMSSLINLKEIAKKNGNLQEAFDVENKLNAIEATLGKIFIGKKRKDFNEMDWAVADQIDFELAYQYFEELTHLFNAEWMASSNLQKKLKDDFDFNYQEAVIAENLASSLAYIEGLEGKTLSLPIWDQQTKRYQSEFFTIKSTILGDALPCYILENQNPHTNPWFIIRGTQPYIGVSSKGKEYRSGGLESLLADSLDHECISRNVINKALTHRRIVNENGQYIQKESLSDIFRTWALQGKKVNLTGHSLGGTIVNALMVEFFDQIQTAYAFSGAGVSEETGRRWDLLNRIYPMLDLYRKLINFDYEGDIIPSGGCRLIGTHVAIKQLAQDSSSGIYHCHVRTHLNHDFQIQKVDVNKETYKWARIFCERLRILVGKCFNWVLWAFNCKYLPDWWKDRKIYRERAEIERKIRRKLTNLMAEATVLTSNC